MSAITTVLPQGGASGLVTGPVFKTVERQTLSLAGSIPVRLRDERSAGGAL